MMLNKVTINNFRNIDHAEYDLKKLNVLTGANAQGKTNTILAIYWAMADYLMDGSSDYASFKPHKDSTSEVSVELDFSTFKFRKTFAEKWVKTRGSTEVTMQGHTTDYYIDDVKYGVTEGKKLLLENLGISEQRNVDVLRAIIDPYYLGLYLVDKDWKALRSFIIDLVGDVDDQTVIGSKKAFELIAKDLEQQKFNANSLTKLYRQHIKTNKDEISKQENVLLGYNDIKDVDEIDLAKAEVNITLIDNDIAALRLQKDSAVNPKIAELESEIAKTRVAYSESLDADRKYLIELNRKSNQEIDNLEKEYQSTQSKLNELRNAQRNQEESKVDYEFKQNSLNRELSELEAQRDRLYKEYDTTQAMVYESIAVNSCPHCGGVLNEKELSIHKEAWEKDKQRLIEANISRGKNVKEQITNVEFKLKELEKPTFVDYETEIKSLVITLDTIKESINSYRSSLINEYVSDTTRELLEKGKELNVRLSQEKEIKTSEDIDAKITKKISEKEPFNQIVADHNAYLVIQKKANATKELIEVGQSALAEYETKLMLLEEFIKTKLTLLKNNVSKVFGDLEFVLIETNIKEGSYNEVCYPLILNKNTPFSSGSGAEKIVTGVYMIECIKKALSLPNLPIIFDEADKLDSNTIATKVVTDSQIISTRVDDVNYERLTLVAK